MAANEKPWTEQDEAKLRFLWERGDSVREIGVAMRRSFHGISPKAARMGLEPRGAVIRPVAPGELTKEARQRAETRLPIPASVRTIPLLPSERRAMGIG